MEKSDGAFPGLQSFILFALSGGLAGLSVDVTLYPLDAFKTRLQSASGFWVTGGFSRPYAGISAVMISSIPSAALFFAGYESTKHVLSKSVLHLSPSIEQMLSAGVGEVMACLVRVPTEIVKQRTQAKTAATVWLSIKQTISDGKGLRGLYRGYGATIARDVPFSFIQYPIWEALKVLLAGEDGSRKTLASPIAGFLAGGLAAAITTPIDVAKTRIMLQRTSKPQGFIRTMSTIYAEGGIRASFSGIVPRVASISIGGAIFLGSYDFYKNQMASILR